MSSADDRDLLAEFSNAVAAYLNSMAATADCLERTYPEVGTPYRQRIHRLRSRVAFDATRKAITDSVQTLEAELKDYSNVANRVLTQRGVELKSGILALSDIIESLAQRQEIFSNRLLHLAAQVEVPADPQNSAEAAARHASGLRDLAEFMSEETALMLAQMREQTVELDQRLAGATSTDPVTGLINRRELDRQMEAHRLHGSTFCLLIFELEGPMSDQVLRMAASKLGTKFRPTDWIARWGAKEFAVLFLSGYDLAKTRAAQTVQLLEGRYTLENGETVLVSARSRVLQPELALA